MTEFNNGLCLSEVKIKNILNDHKFIKFLFVMAHYFDDFIATFNNQLVRSGCIFLFSLGLLQGCMHVGNGVLEIDDTPPDLNYLPVLVPFLLGGHGSAIPITDTMSLTSAHVARYDYSNVIAYHPVCDVALIEANNKNKNKLKMGMIYSGESLTNYGYEFTGKVVKGEGIYIMDVIIQEYPECNYSLNTAPQKSGMSGGPVINSTGELVGVIHGIGFDPPVLLETNEQVNLERYSYFVSIKFIRDWVDSHIKDMN